MTFLVMSLSLILAMIGLVEGVSTLAQVVSLVQLAVEDALLRFVNSCCWLDLQQK